MIIFIYVTITSQQKKNKLMDFAHKFVKPNSEGANQDKILIKENTSDVATWDFFSVTFCINLKEPYKAHFCKNIQG